MGGGGVRNWWRSERWENVGERENPVQTASERACSKMSRALRVVTRLLEATSWAVLRVWPRLGRLGTPTHLLLLARIAR